MDPTPEKLLASFTLDAIADGVLLAHRPEGEGEDDSPKGSFCWALEARSALHPRSPAAMPAADLDACQQAARVSEAAPTAVVRNQGGIVGRFRWVSCGTQRRAGDFSTQQADLLQLQIQAQAAAAVLLVQPQAASGVAASPERVMLCNVVDQANDAVILEPDPAAVAAGLLRYQTAAGGPQALHGGLTLELLSALHLLLSSTSASHEGFPVWGPFGHRVSKRVKLAGMVIGADGTPHTVEHYGAANYDA